MTDITDLFLRVTGRWEKAEALGMRLAGRDPANHWLWARLASVHYQQHRYSDALKDAMRALELEQRCALALWEKAEAEYMLGHYRDASQTYRKITSRGVSGVIKHMCSEGKGWARALVSDSYYRLGRSYAKQRKYGIAIDALRCGIALRGPGIRSLFSIRELRDVLAWLQEMQQR